MAILPVHVQKRYRELGRIRMGSRGDKGQPVRSETFRMTSPDRNLLDKAADLWGGTVTEWTDAPTDGTQYELVTTSTEMSVIVPPQDVAAGQFFELWTAGGCVRRCDGATETISGDPCLCDPEARECRPTTHLLVMLPELPDVGAWRVTTHGFNAAAEIPQTAAFLQQIMAAGTMPAATLALEGRTSKKDGQTRHYVVPVLRIPQTLLELADVGAAGISIPTSATAGALPSVAPELAEPPPKPSLPDDSPPLPPDPSFGAAGEAAVERSATPPLPASPTFAQQVVDHLDMETADGDTMAMQEAWVRQLYNLMDRAKVDKWDLREPDALHRALKTHYEADHLGDLNKAKLVAFRKASSEAARVAIGGQG